MHQFRITQESNLNTNLLSSSVCKMIKIYWDVSNNDEVLDRDTHTQAAHTQTRHAHECKHRAR